MILMARHRVAAGQQRRWAILLGHAFAAWALCTASMMLGMAVAGVDVALVVHAIGAPIFAAGTWIPFALIFSSTYVTGRAVERRHGSAAQGR